MEVAATGFTGFTGSTEDAKTTTASNGTQPTSPTTEDPDSPPAVATCPNSKSKEIGEEFVNTTEGHAERMSDMPAGEDGWRAYYEHPLTAATTAMLNINGTTEEQNSTGVGLLYEYYKLPPIEKVAEKALAEKYAASIPEIWTAAVTSTGTAAAAAALLTTALSPRSGSSAKPVSSPSTAERDSEAQPATAVLTPSEAVIYLSRAQVKPDPEDLLRNAANEASISSPESAGEPLTNGEVALSPTPPTSIKQEASVSPLTAASPSPPLQLAPSPSSSQSDLPVDLVAVTAPLPPSAVAVSTSPVAGSPDSAKSREMQASQQGSTVIALGAAATQPFSTQVFTSQATYETLGMAQYGVLTNAVAVAPPQYGAQTSNGGRTLASNVYTFAAAAATGDYYRDYYSPSSTPSAADQYQTVRQHLTSYAEGGGDGSAAFVDRYIRQNGSYKTNLHGLTVDLPSPDSGIGEATITPRDSAGLSQIFDYSELSQTQTILQTTTSADPSPSPSVSSRPASQSSRRSWHEFGRNSESDKVQIPKLHSDVGFKYFLESPISTSQRREDDRITYINKGQFYGITLEYLPDPDKPLKSPTVKTIVMLVFREEKTHEDEIKAWSFWHSRQHSVKQRILDADTKNSSGIIGQIDEITHNAIAFYWNPMESPAKINVAVQCLSTDFSNQKGVKGLPLHIQVDTFDDYREGSTPVHRGYCQIKVFCDKGAERKTRDEERRAAKRKLTATGSKCGQTSVLSSNPQQPSFLPAPPGGRKKMEEMYHPPMDRSEFYSMSDLLKPAVLFTPSDELDKKEISTISQQMAGMELTFYAHANVTEDPSVLDRREKDSANETELTFTHPPSKRIKIYPSDRDLQNDRFDLVPQWTRSDDRNEWPQKVLLYARRETEDIYHALHLVPPSLAGLANAIESKYKIGHNSIRSIYKRCSKGITVQMDDDIIKHYCNEDTFIIEIIKTEDELYDVTLVEL